MPERLRIGSVEIAVARDADFQFTPANSLRDAAGAEIPEEQLRAALGGQHPAVAQESRVLTFVVRSRGQTILVDSGVGPWGVWRFGDGHLLDSLAALDLTPAQIDVVLPTHLHLDHVGWNTLPSPNGPVPTFPNARYLFQQADWDYFTSEQFLSQDVPLTQMVRNAVLPLRDTGLMELIGPERAITDEVTLLQTPGHTPGSVTVLIQSGGEAALLFGDAAHHPVEFVEPDWSPLYDIDRSLSARSRVALIAEAQRLDAYLAGAHFLAAEPTFGRIVPIAGRPTWQGVTLSAE